MFFQKISLMGTQLVVIFPGFISLILMSCTSFEKSQPKDMSYQKKVTDRNIASINEMSEITNYEVDVIGSEPLAYLGASGLWAQAIVVDLSKESCKVEGLPVGPAFDMYCFFKIAVPSFVDVIEIAPISEPQKDFSGIQTAFHDRKLSQAYEANEVKVATWSAEEDGQHYIIIRLIETLGPSLLVLKIH